MDSGTILYGLATVIYGVGLTLLLVFYAGEDKVALATILSTAFGGICFQIAAYLKSAGNAEKITKVDDKLNNTNAKVDDNTSLTTELKVAVDGRITQLIDALNAAAASQGQLDKATSKAEGVEIGRAQATNDQAVAALVGPAIAHGGTPTGTTIAGPVQITPTGDTTVILPPDAKTGLDRI